jgi:hypothetical protein
MRKAVAPHVRLGDGDCFAVHVGGPEHRVRRRGRDRDRQRPGAGADVVRTGSP